MNLLRVYGLLVCLCLLRPAQGVWAQTSPEAPRLEAPRLEAPRLEAPRLEFVAELRVNIAPALVVGETPHGVRRIIPITGGTVTGPNLSGTIVNGGADWQIVRNDGTTELEARYSFKTDDGTLIYISNKGIRVATPEVARRIASGEAVNPSEYYFRAIPTFETPPGRYEWLTKTLFISKGIRMPDGVLIQVWKIL